MVMPKCPVETGASSLTLSDAAGKSQAWRRYCNEERPQGAIGKNVLIMLPKSGGITSLSP